MCRLPEEHIGCHLPCPGIERDRRLVCEDHRSFMGGKGRPEQIPDLLCRHPRAGC